MINSFRVVLILILIIFLSTGVEANQLVECKEISSTEEYDAPNEFSIINSKTVCLEFTNTSEVSSDNIFSLGLIGIPIEHIKVTGDGQLVEHIYPELGVSTLSNLNGYDSLKFYITIKPTIKKISILVSQSVYAGKNDIAILIDELYQPKSVTKEYGKKSSASLSFSFLTLEARLAQMINLSPNCSSNNISPNAPDEFNASLNNNLSWGENIKNTEVSRELTYLWFYSQVKNKAPFDFKQVAPQYADYGNFHYGALGASLGIPSFVLLRMAGWAQINAETSNKTWGFYLGAAPYGDDPDDQLQIQKGINYYNEVFKSASYDTKRNFSDFCNLHNQEQNESLWEAAAILMDAIRNTGETYTPSSRGPTMQLFCNDCHEYRGSINPDYGNG
jgi:hypothetical protein